MARQIDCCSVGVPPSLARGAVAARWMCMAAAGVFAAVVGCGGSKQTTYRAGGKVTFADGTPLTGGRVSFRSLDADKKVTARGEIQSDGTFELTTYKPGDGAVEGQHQALILPLIQVDRGDIVGVTRPPPAQQIDPRFSNFETSGLTFTVTDDPEQNQFEIAVAPPKR